MQLIQLCYIHLCMEGPQTNLVPAQKILRRWLPENFVSYCGTKDGVVHFL